MRQEGFTRLAHRLAEVRPSADPVRDLTALVSAYLGNALEHPDLYRVMFDANFEPEDAKAADDTLEYLVQAAERGRRDGRYREDVVALELATQSWAIAHGVVSLVANGPLPRGTLDHGAALLTALFVSVGDQPRRCHRSVRRGWRLPA
ncbi:TetR-like C-terminal domain-containing protein [Amycolatopsis jiangsuensis]|uniref:HTH-type transcriptional regulator MT1864/Rv1816-like C-terminal domain-containing protein n=1 Tax=Amycolatopsis jiangsuensis TaxID=1181879 RepID=A0A840IY34_9PSEU|nr:TetR-like C-terminal domain-containing protein [Amycolatopsis jiangsuensis]MBB4686613.1 hypothetical protein [Amycolatopsis jiangsuensis]